MQFLQSIWLWGMLGMAIPFLIHLWNIRPGRVVKVGSISLLKKTKGQNARSLKLRELMLLAVRCALIAALSVYLARPVFRTETHNENDRWLVIAKTDLQNALMQNGKLIDSLRKAGFEFRNTDTAFTKYNFDDTANATSQTLLSGWDVVREMNESFTGEKAIIISSAKMSNYSGSKPLLPKNIVWHALDSAADATRWLQNVFLQDDSALLVWGNSSAEKTYFETEKVHRNIFTSPPFAQSLHNNQLKIEWKSAAGNVVEADSSGLDIIVVPGNNQADARYVMAALRAIADNALQPVNIKVMAENDSLGKADWVFWLAATPVPTLDEKTKLFRYGNNKIAIVNSLIAFQKNFSVPDPQQVFKQGTLTGMHAIWQDGAGNIILGKNENEYLFASRFLPSATSLVWSEQFPHLLSQILLTSSMPVLDNRQISAVQSRPLIGTKTSQKNISGKVANPNTKYFLGGALLLLLCIERILSHKNTSSK